MDTPMTNKKSNDEEQAIKTPNKQEKFNSNLEATNKPAASEAEEKSTAPSKESNPITNSENNVKLA